MGRNGTDREKLSPVALVGLLVGWKLEEELRMDRDRRTKLEEIVTQGRK